MRRTDREFREELLRRQQEYQERQKKRRKKILSAVGCTILVILGGAMMLPMMPAMSGSSAEMAPEYSMNDMAQMPMGEAAPAEGEAGWDLLPMVMIDEVLYLDTGYISQEEDTTSDGEITSAVPGSQTPAEHCQSNFGTGYSYRYGRRDGTVEIYMNGNWWIFASKEVRDELLYSE